jgi:Fe-S-cluster-containing hydrogenase component 2
MPYVVGPDCVDVLDRSCVEACPVDAIYEGSRKAYVHPEECIDCGACEPVCPVTAIFWARDASADQVPHIGDAHTFFYATLPGRSQPISEPGGARRSGVVGVDTPLVAGRPMPPAT